MDEAILQQRLRDMTLSPPNTRYIIHTCMYIGGNVHYSNKTTTHPIYIMYMYMCTCTCTCVHVHNIYCVLLEFGNVQYHKWWVGCGFVTVVNVTTYLDNWVLYRRERISIFVYNKSGI